ncbi:hypothetical protein CFE70_005773 [Pyrenophora teres f. teres 0-1]|uniref:3'-5' exonuclease domain-containing protein n=2 Tax=Pyrenophora teres f. teres TaxID=97479 RepID=E3S3M1_PYRTT|nr:hypothetical protein PTT_17080 [Pyrenophora teres f. teres 0-1]CAE7177921.1 DNA pol A exo1 domain containing protein [Pyrenophora teres f. teres]
MAEDNSQIRQTSAALHVRHPWNTMAQRSDGLQRVGLWNPAQGLRFATTAAMERQRSDPPPGDAKSVLQPEAETPEILETELNTLYTGSGTVQDVQAIAGDDTCSAASDAIQSIESSQDIETDSVTLGEESEQEPAAQDGQEEADDYIPLSYQIPEDKLRAAMLASPNTRASYWSAKLYQGPDGEQLQTHYCKTFDVAERVAQYFLREKVVGFDIEWKPRGNPHSIKQNASLVQLACENRIALFHLALFPGRKVEKLMPPSLRAVLESLDIYKVGVAIKGDFTRLEKYLGIQPQGVFELSRLHNLVEWHDVDPSKISKKLVGLAAQVHQHLQLPLYKGEQLDDDPEETASVRESDWSLPLSLEQIHYAAADAYAGYRLYYMLEWKRTRLRPTPPPIPLCDYDNKPDPNKVKVPRKKTKVATKSEDVVETAQESSVDAADQEQEELIDSHQVEDTSSSASHKEVQDTGEAYFGVDHTESEMVRGAGSDMGISSSSKRVGRVKLSILTSTDPEYPTLPRTSQEEATESMSTEGSKDDASKDGDGDVLFRSQLSDSLDASEDAYDDPELEEALGCMTLDDSGKLTEDAKSSAMEHTKPPESKAKVAELQEVAETIRLVPASVAGLAEEVKPVSEFDTATTWAQGYVQSTIPCPSSTAPSRIRATVPHLRAYHLWHHQKRSIEDIRRVLRDPPMSSTTVTNYILQAVVLEKLEYEEKSLKSVMLMMSSGMRKGRWRALAEEVGALD